MIVRKTCSDWEKSARTRSQCDPGMKHPGLHYRVYPDRFSAVSKMDYLPNQPFISFRSHAFPAAGISLPTLARVARPCLPFT